MSNPSGDLRPGPGATGRSTGAGVGETRGPVALDIGATLGDAPTMTEKRYSIPVDELVSSARVPVTEQVEVEAEERQPGADWSTGGGRHGDGMSGDADGD